MQFVGVFLGGDPSALPKVAGVTPTIIAAATSAVKTISAQSFQNVWIANAAIGGATFLRTSTNDSRYRRDLLTDLSDTSPKTSRRQDDGPRGESTRGRQAA